MILSIIHTFTLVAVSVLTAMHVMSATNRDAVITAIFQMWLAMGVIDFTWFVIYIVMGGTWFIHLVVSLICFVLAYSVYRIRRNRRKMLKAIGAKARALLAAVADSARQLAEGVRNPLPGVRVADGNF